MTTIIGGSGADTITGTNGGELTDLSFNGSIAPTGFSPDGSQLVLGGPAGNLVPGDTDGTDDVFLLNMISGALTRISTDSSGGQGDGASLDGVFSPDGTKVAMDGLADNLVLGDNNGTFDVFLKDLATGAMTLISANAAGVVGDGQSLGPVFSPDGTKVAFYSFADNLVAGDTNGLPDHFVKDLVTGQVALVDTNAVGVQAHIDTSHGYSIGVPAFSPDGTKVVFDSYADNLVPGDTNGTPDIFIKDLVTGAVTRVNTTASGGQSTGTLELAPVFSPDGTKVAFCTNASDLGPVDTNGTADIYVKDLVTGAVTRVSTNSAGGEGDGFSGGNFAFSADGTKIAFQSSADNLVPNDTNGTSDVFVKDLVAGATTRISTDAAGGQLTRIQGSPLFSPDGTLVAFQAYNGNTTDALIKNIGDGSDLITGGGGNDIIDGKGGIDTAVYSGVLSDYLVTSLGGVTTVQDLRAGSPDGTDQLTNVERLQFADQTISTSGPNNSPPVAAADSASTAYSTPVVIPVSTLLANDSDPDGNSLALVSVGSALHGTVSLSGGNVTFTPYLGYVGAAGFSYAIDDGHGGTATGQVAVNVTGTSPGYIYRAGIAAGETIDTSGDGSNHNIVLGSGDDTVFTGAGGSSVKLGAGSDVVVGGTGKDTVTFGPGLGRVTGGSGPDVFVFVKGQIADPTAHGGAYDTVTDFSGAGSTYAPGRDFIYLKGFATTATITYEHDLSGDPTAHLYRVDDGAYHGEFVLDYAGPGVALSHSQFGFL